MRESLDEAPEATRIEWTLSPAHLLGDSFPRAPGLLLHRVWNYLGVSYDTTRCIEKTGTRTHQSFSGVALARTTVLPTAGARISTLKRGLVQPQAVPSNRNEVSCNRLGSMLHQSYADGHPTPVGHSSVHLTPEAS